MAELRHSVHSFAPVITKESRILILGSAPSVKSEEKGFYYMHPRNRFWKVMEAILAYPFPILTTDQKTAALNASKIALYDSISECDIAGSSDSKIFNVIPADIPGLIAGTGVKLILANGAMSYMTVSGYYPELTDMCVKMPSTSPANAQYSTRKLIECWREVIDQYTV